jgi:type I restriction enzyme S subunit
MKDWKKSELGNIAAINYGYTAKAAFEEVGPKFLRITDIQNDSVDWSGVPHCPIDEADFKKHKLHDQDIVFARTGATTGKSYLVYDPPESVAASYLIRLRVQDSGVSAQFVSKYFQTREYWDSVTSGISGSAQGGFNASKLSAMVIPIPPIAEQKQIVAILDEAFEGIDSAIANTEKNLVNARELFESYLNALFTRKDDLPTVSIGDVGEVFDGPHATPKTIDSGPIFLGISSLQDGQIRLEKTRHVSTEDYKKWTRRVEPRADDIVFSYETRLGQAAIIPKDFQCCLGRRMGLVRFDQSKVEPRYFLYLYLSPPYRKFLDEKTVRGATVDRISIKEFPSFPVSLPSIDEQRDIVAKVESFSQQSQRLEAIYQQKLVALNELKQSILQRAFSGELTAEVGDAAVEGAKEVVAA